MVSVLESHVYNHTDARPFSITVDHYHSPNSIHRVSDTINGYSFYSENILCKHLEQPFQTLVVFYASSSINHRRQMWLDSLCFGHEMDLKYLSSY